MSNIKTIVHLSDIHIRKTPTRNEEYEMVFKNLIKSLEEKKPDRIVIVGDLVHDYLDLQGEQLILACDLLNNLSKIAPVRITRGNHDYRKANHNRVDSIKAIVKILHNPNVLYYDSTGFFEDDNVTWAVWHHGDKNNNPWKIMKGKKILSERSNQPDKIYIDLFHDPISGCKSTTGFEMNSKSYNNLNNFCGDFLFAGDIHKMQYLDNKKTKAYSGSLLANDISEGDDQFHGYLLWDIIDKTCQEIPIHNDYSFKNVKITPYTDFDDLDYEIPNPTKYMRIRFIWGTLPQTRNKNNEIKLVEYFKRKYSNIIISNKNEFIENEKIDINQNVTLENITNTAVQNEIIRKFLEKIGSEKQLIDDVINLDEEINSNIKLGNISNVEWNIIKFGGINFMSYHKFDIDWRDMDGLFQIIGKNVAGKTTIIKTLSYILFGKTIETESRIKYGDKRFINNRNDASYCEGYLVLEANGEYYGIKKRTDITKTKDGEITGAPTTLNYYVLSNPDEPMDVNTSLEKLDGNRRSETQNKINLIIGDYDNFMRIVMTTSDTLNAILKNDMAEFIDSLLYDSGLDVFDKKLEELKIYQKKVNEKSRIVCDILKTNEENIVLNNEIINLNNEITKYETINLPEVQEKIKTGRTYVETLTKKLFKIDPEIYSLDVNKTKGIVNTYNKTISDLKVRKSIIEESIKPLKENYDVERLNILIEKKDNNKNFEYNQKLIIKNHEQQKMVEEHAIEIINGNIFRHKTKGTDYKKQISELKESKICTQCGQTLTVEHQIHINEKIKSVEVLMFSLADEINRWENVDKKNHSDRIIRENNIIKTINEEIKKASFEMEDILNEIGILTNDKNDVDKRKELQIELDQIPMKVQNEELKIAILQQKIDDHDNSLLHIEENHKIELGINAAKLKIDTLIVEEQEFREDIFSRKTLIGAKSLKIKNNEQLINEYKAQEYRNSVIELYKKCVHRDGIPRQILVSYVIPRINLTLENILSVAEFKIWLNVDDLRPKLVYYDRPNSIIDCISASGKERTFSSVVLKFALNQINVKSKPTMFLLDEVMGKLDEDSIEEFIQILHIIKNQMKKVLIIEHRVNINPDYLISVGIDEEGISSLSVE